MAAVKFVSAKALNDFVTELFVSAGLPKGDAQQVSSCLVTANLRGVDSHGVTRVPIYLRRIRQGLVNRRPEIRVANTAPSVAVVDGDNGMGAVVGNVAVAEAIRLARETGVSAVGVRNSNHYGIAAFYLLKAVEEGCAGLTVTNAPPTMAPYGARQPFFGTNPWAIAVPAGKHPAVLLDMATSIVARGKIILAEQRNEAIPQGWALDREGKPTTDATAALAGAVLPFGGPKGSALAMFADILAGVLTGAAFGRDINDLYRNFDEPQNIGHFFIACDIEAFMPLSKFAERMEILLQSLKACELAQGHSQVLAPGEVEAITERERLAKGIPLTPDIVEMLAQEATEAQVVLPEMRASPLEEPAQ